MSSVTRRPNGHHWVGFSWRGKRHTIRLGPIPYDEARAFQRRLDRLIGARIAGYEPDAEVRDWLAKMGDRPYKSLLIAGLVTSRGPSTLGELIERHEIHQRARGVKPSTLVNGRVLYDNLLAHFGAGQRISDITLDAADGFKLWMLGCGRRDGGPLEKSTVTNRCRRARGIFAYAIENEWLRSNPFRLQGQGSEVNRSRDLYVSRDLFAKVIDCTANHELRLLLGMVRYAGLRCPSEVRPMTLAQWDAAASLLVIHSPKTEGHEGHERREVPVFAELHELLNAAWDMLPKRQPLMFPHYQITGAAITGKLAALCRKAGEPLWSKPMVNLRASCERDWLKVHRFDDVAHWMGHSPQTMLRHYSRVVKDQRLRAASGEFPTSQPEAKCEGP